MLLVRQLNLQDKNPTEIYKKMKILIDFGIFIFVLCTYNFVSIWENGYIKVKILMIIYIILSDNLYFKTNFGNFVIE